MNYNQPNHNRRDSNYYVKKNNPRQIPPFWLSKSRFYFLSIVVALVIFFFLWAIIQESGDKTPWITAGLITSILLLCAFFLREFVLRKTKYAYVVSKNNSEFSLSKRTSNGGNKSGKLALSLQQNSSFLNRIEKKSKQARKNNQLVEGHLEAFRLCEDYMNLTSKELKKAAVGSTKWGAIKNGRKRVRKVHKHHLISWAALESRRLTKEAKLKGTIAGKIETAQQANLVLESALSFYPEDSQLIDSIEAVSDFISSIKISHWIELAEKATFKGNYKRAISHYKDALFYLARETIGNIDKDQLAQKINKEIKHLRKLNN